MGIYFKKLPLLEIFSGISAKLRKREDSSFFWSSWSLQDPERMLLQLVLWSSVTRRVCALSQASPWIKPSSEHSLDHKMWWRLHILVLTNKPVQRDIQKLGTLESKFLQWQVWLSVTVISTCLGLSKEHASQAALPALTWHSHRQKLHKILGTLEHCHSHLRLWLWQKHFQPGKDCLKRAQRKPKGSEVQESRSLLIRYLPRRSGF